MASLDFQKSLDSDVVRATILGWTVFLISFLFKQLTGLEKQCVLIARNDERADTALAILIINDTLTRTSAMTDHHQPSSL